MPCEVIGREPTFSSIYRRTGDCSLPQIGGRWVVVTFPTSSPMPSRETRLLLDPARHSTGRLAPMGSPSRCYVFMGRAQPRRSSGAPRLATVSSVISGRSFAISPNRKDWGIFTRCRCLLGALEIYPPDALLPLPSRRLHVGSHVQEYLVDLGDEWE